MCHTGGIQTSRREGEGPARRWSTVRRVCLDQLVAWIKGQALRATVRRILPPRTSGFAPKHGARLNGSSGVCFSQIASNTKTRIFAFLHFYILYVGEICLRCNHVFAWEGFFYSLWPNLCHVLTGGSNLKSVALTVTFSQASSSLKYVVTRCFILCLYFRAPHFHPLANIK